MLDSIVSSIATHYSCASCMYLFHLCDMQHICNSKLAYIPGMTESIGTCILVSGNRGVTGATGDCVGTDVFKLSSTPVAFNSLSDFLTGG